MLNLMGRLDSVFFYFFSPEFSRFFGAVNAESKRRFLWGGCIEHVFLFYIALLLCRGVQLFCLCSCSVVRMRP